MHRLKTLAGIDPISIREVTTATLIEFELPDLQRARHFLSRLRNQQQSSSERTLRPTTTTTPANQANITSAANT